MGELFEYRFAVYHLHIARAIIVDCSYWCIIESSPYTNDDQGGGFKLVAEETRMYDIAEQAISERADAHRDTNPLRVMALRLKCDSSHNP